MHIYNIIQTRKGNSMKAKKAKEQLIAIALLSSVFIFFIYLKTNPEINNMSSNNQSQINKIVNDKAQEINLEINEFSNEEILIEEISEPSKTEESIAMFTERELKRAKAYIDKDWRPDDTINMAAWDYVSKNPSINNYKNDNTSYLEYNQVANTNIK